MIKKSEVAAVEPKEKNTRFFGYGKREKLANRYQDLKVLSSVKLGGVLGGENKKALLH